jgi:hypothetical protein
LQLLTIRIFAAPPAVEVDPLIGSMLLAEFAILYESGRAAHVVGGGEGVCGRFYKRRPQGRGLLAAQGASGFVGVGGGEFGVRGNGFHCSNSEATGDVAEELKSPNRKIGAGCASRQKNPKGSIKMADKRRKIGCTGYLLYLM